MKIQRQPQIIHAYDSPGGVLHTLLGIRDRTALLGHPKLGSSWEGFALREVVERLGAQPEECFFWATHGGAELDLLVVRGHKRLGFEFKRTETPRIAPSMRVAMSDLGLTKLYVVHAGKESWALAPRTPAVALHRLLEDLQPL